MPALQYPLLMRTNSVKGEFIPEPGTNQYDIFADEGPTVGMFMDFLTQLSERAGFTFTVRAISGASSAEAKSQFTSCVRDVHKGIADVCVGRSWETVERSQLAQFATSIVFDNIRLLVRSPAENNSLYFKAVLVFSPFFVQAWFGIMGSTFFVALTYVQCRSWKAREVKARGRVAPFRALEHPKTNP